MNIYEITKTDNPRCPDRQEIPVLVEHVRQIADPGLQKSTARYLCTAFARFARWTPPSLRTAFEEGMTSLASIEVAAETRTASENAKRYL